MIQGETISGSPEGKPHGCADHSAELSSLKFMLESNAKLLDPSSEQLQKRERERVGFSKDCDERDCYRKKQETMLRENERESDDGGNRGCQITNTRSTKI